MHSELLLKRCRRASVFHKQYNLRPLLHRDYIPWSLLGKQRYQCDKKSKGTVRAQNCLSFTQIANRHLPHTKTQVGVKWEPESCKHPYPWQRQDVKTAREGHRLRHRREQLLPTSSAPCNATGALRLQHSVLFPTSRPLPLLSSLPEVSFPNLSA